MIIGEVPPQPLKTIKNKRMKKLFFFAFLLIASIANAQNTIDWDGKYQLQLSDFRSPATQIGGTAVASLHTASTIDFSFQMTNAEFLFTKNFNNKVNCCFKCDAGSLIAPDSLTASRLLDFARYEFDLSELYARKFRKKIYENKGVFSNVTFFKPVYDIIEKELSERDALAGKETKMGMDSLRLQQLHKQVLQEIRELPGFCKTCKPPKKKKRR
jgi:hypothetical protein